MPIGAAIGLAGVAGAGASIFSANRAASTQQAATTAATNLARQQYDTTRNDLQPFRAIGTQAASEMSNRLDFLTSPIVMDQENLKKTPGYQFTRTQGLKAVQNSAAARGLGSSGAALKGAATFATGLADQTYKDQFALENTNRTNAYDRLRGLIDVGEAASAQTGILGAKAADTAASATIGGANAGAAAINASGNALSNLAGNLGGYAAYRGLYGNNNSGGGGGGQAPPGWQLVPA